MARSGDIVSGPEHFTLTDVTHYESPQTTLYFELLRIDPDLVEDKSALSNIKATLKRSERNVDLMDSLERACNESSRIRDSLFGTSDRYFNNGLITIFSKELGSRILSNPDKFALGVASFVFNKYLKSGISNIPEDISQRSKFVSSIFQRYIGEMITETSENGKYVFSEEDIWKFAEDIEWYITLFSKLYGVKDTSQCRNLVTGFLRGAASSAQSAALIQSSDKGVKIYPASTVLDVDLAVDAVGEKFFMKKGVRCIQPVVVQSKSISGIDQKGGRADKPYLSVTARGAKPSLPYEVVEYKENGLTPYIGGYKFVPVLSRNENVIGIESNYLTVDKGKVTFRRFPDQSEKDLNQYLMNFLEVICKDVSKDQSFESLLEALSFRKPSYIKAKLARDESLKAYSKFFRGQLAEFIILSFKAYYGHQLDMYPLRKYGRAVPVYPPSMYFIQSGFNDDPRSFSSFLIKSTAFIRSIQSQPNSKVIVG